MLVHEQESLSSFPPLIIAFGNGIIVDADYVQQLSVERYQLTATESPMPITCIRPPHALQCKSEIEALVAVLLTRNDIRLIHGFLL